MLLPIISMHPIVKAREDKKGDLMIASWKYNHSKSPPHVRCAYTTGVPNPILLLA